MTEKSEQTIKDFHKKFAVEAFNNTWNYIEKENRTEDDDMKMINLAHASRYHWGFVGQALHFERGEWLIAKVYSELKVFDRALYHSKKCLSICIENDILDFDIAFAYEGLARSYKLMNDEEKFKTNFDLAMKVSEDIADQEDKEYFLSELKKLEA